MNRIAFSDESFKGGPKAAYAVAAAIILGADAEDVRADLRHLFRSHRRRFHWRHEEPRDKARMVEFIRERQIQGFAAVRPLGDPRGQERARAQCIERVLWDLKLLGVDHLVLEARQERNNQRDRRLIIAAQKAGKASSSLEYSFGYPLEEPLLWIPDALAGAATAAWCDGVPAHLRVLGSLLEPVELS